MKILSTLQRLLGAFQHEFGASCSDRRSVLVAPSRCLLSVEGDLGDLEVLPAEMQLLVLSFFSMRELVPLFRVSRKVNYLASCNYLWRRFVVADVHDFEKLKLPERNNAGDLSVVNKEIMRLHGTVWKWDPNTPARSHNKAPAIQLADSGRTAFRASQVGTNPAVLASLPFNKYRTSFEVKVIARGSWLGIGAADKAYKTLDGPTLGKQRQGVNSAFFCQDTTVLQIEGGRRTRSEKIVAQRIEAGDRIRVKVDLASNSIVYYRNGSLVGSLRVDRCLVDVELYPCLNLSQGSSVVLLDPSGSLPNFGRLSPVC